jgi:hypothetical protein
MKKKNLLPQDASMAMKPTLTSFDLTCEFFNTKIKQKNLKSHGCVVEWWVPWLLGEGQQWLWLL